MIGLTLAKPGQRLKLLCLGAHADDIEIGAGATLLSLLGAGEVDVHWAVLSAAGERADEARASAKAFLARASQCTIEVGDFRDGYFPYQGADIKDWMNGLAGRVQPDVVFTHHRDDAHQDHRLVAELTGNHFRDTLTLAYEIPKWDGDLGRPNVYVPITSATVETKIALLSEHFPSQAGKDWFDADTFRGLARLRGMECRSPERYAEAFHCSKMALTLAAGNI
ncbi:MAG: PIG-L deacetylase family protein [Hyphomicrobiaceae bacterium]